MADAERSAPIAPRSARPVMFLHGPLASGRMWRAYAADLDAAVASLAPDLTGYGETPARPDGAPFRLCDEFAGIDAAPGDTGGEPVPRRADAVRRQAACMARNFGAGFRDGPSLADPARLDVPALIVTGRNSPRAAIAASRVVLGVLPKADCLSIPGAGYMLPVTHADLCRRLVRDWRRGGQAVARERAA